MKQKSWMKRYGIHAMICVVIIAAAFGINRKINIDRNHIYTVSEGITTLLKDVTLETNEKGKVSFIGWGFDTEYYNENVKNEIILQDTETGEALWPKMVKNPKPVQIDERYTDGRDYSEAGFEGILKESELKKDSVYEVLLRYTSTFTDEAGTEQTYVRTVATDEFLYQGEMTGYNPKTFVAPKITGTELEQELEGARLFHYFPEGMWVYYDEINLYYVLDKGYFNDRKDNEIVVQWFFADTEKLPEERRQYGYGNAGFILENKLDMAISTEQYEILKVEIPAKGEMYFQTGVYSKGWILKSIKQICF
ncbi:MAG: hypothetical protein ACOCNB_09515 [Acetivibrio ethanolgignens]